MIQREEIEMLKKSGLILFLIIALLVSGSSGAIAATNKKTEIIVSAAASLTDSLLFLEKAYEASHPNINLTFNFGASGALQQQIEQGAPADVFISAGAKQMQALVDKGFVEKTSQTNLLSNDLVLVMPINTKLKLAKATSRELTKPEFKVIAMGIPESVPAGQYAKETLEYLKIYDTLQSKIVQAKDVRAVLTYVETGNADAGYVYRTDALTSKKVKIVLTIDPKAHKPIVYPAGVIKESKHAQEAADFYKYLQGKEATDVFVKFGFKLAPKS